MIAYCIKNYYGFKKGKNYKIISKHSIFEKNDFLTIESNEELSHKLYRFRLNKSLDYIDDYIGKNEVYFYEFFINITEDRKNKLNKLNS